MKITPKELIELGLWERYCKETGTNKYAINEGLIEPNEEFEWNILKSEKNEIKRIDDEKK